MKKNIFLDHFLCNIMQPKTSNKDFFGIRQKLIMSFVQARTKHPPTLALTTFGQIKEVVTGTWRLLTNSPAEIAKIIGT